MPNAAETPESTRGWVGPALAIVLVLGTLRLYALWVTPLELFVDEAQYWLWGQEPALGYYSKPPMIGWVIRFFNEIGGSDAAFWIRVKGPVIHAVLAMIFGSIAARYWGARAGLVTAAGYATLPMVAMASLFASTDTVMYLPLTMALALYLRLLDRPHGATALLAGLCLGLAFLGKYAAVYFLICGVLAALLIPASRPRQRDAALLLAAFALTISPNLLWNLQNGFSTLEHTLDNADWVRDPGARAGLNLSGLAEFFFAQFAVFGPVSFALLLGRWLRFRRLDARDRTLVLFSAPILAIVCIQALLSGAYANWAAAAYVAGTLLVLPHLRGLWLWSGFALNGALCALVLMASIFANSGPLADHPALKRYKGRVAMSETIIATAKDAGLGTIVASNRDVLADLFHTGRGSGLKIFALPPNGRAPHHYALKFPYRGGPDPVLFVAERPSPPDCVAGQSPLDVIAPNSGTYAGSHRALYVVPGTCWADEDS